MIRNVLHLRSSHEVDKSNLRLLAIDAERCADCIVSAWEDNGKPRGRFEISVRFVPYDSAQKALER